MLQMSHFIVATTSTSQAGEESDVIEAALELLPSPFRVHPRGSWLYVLEQKPQDMLFRIVRSCLLRGVAKATGLID